MRGHGFPDAQTTGPGADGGIDVRASGAVARVKIFTGDRVADAGPMGERGRLDHLAGGTRSHGWRPP